MAKPLKEQLKEHKTEVLVGILGIAGAYALYKRSKSSSASSSTGVAVSTPATVVTPGAGGVPGTSVATTRGATAYNGMENQILGLQQALLTLSNKRAGTPATHINPGGALHTPPPPKTQRVGTPAPTPFTSHIQTVTLSQQAFAGQGYYLSSGQGRQMGNILGSTGSIFSTESTATSSIAALEAGQTLYDETSLGGFTPITSVAQFNKIESTPHGKTTTFAKVA